MSTAGHVRPTGVSGHKVAVITVLCAAIVTAIYLGWQGAGYYLLPLTDRPFHPQHVALRPAGYIGIRLGLASLVLFAGIYLYPLRKRVKPMQRVGKTRNWLDIHVLLGLIVPVIVTYHSSLKLNGLAGVAYWIMIAIVVSGFVGRYLYAQIPRSVGAAERSLQELETEADALAAELHTQNVFGKAELDALLQMPSSREVAAMSLWSAIFTMARLDLSRPWRIARARRKVLSPGELWTTLGGLRRSSHEELENVLATARAQSWLTSKILFLNRAGQVLHLWHVVHRPFSYSFVILVAAHIGTVLMMGYF
ncbi:hypothetical protein [Paludibaculum fermentans]|uniref:hypothetical protein n=1 Tax=Paludibaculum fermentans TaxID=1473598 RepID=UPI003EBF17EC